jgi:pimeloyl-ACP methyl ester carboxylesterase
MPKFNSDGVEIAYIDEGEGDPILLIHGFASNIHTNWIDPKWVKTLTDAGYRAIALDNRGHGQSQKLYDEADYGAPIMAGDAQRLLKHLGLGEAHVLGYSMGARIAVFLALQNPELIRSMVVAGMGINMVRGFGAPGPIAAALEADSADDVTSIAARSFRIFAESTGGDLKALATCIRSSREKVTEETLSRISIPTMVAVGSKDVIGGSASELADLIPGAEALEIPDRDHMKAVGDKVFKAAVLRFLGENS